MNYKDSEFPGYKRGELPVPTMRDLTKREYIAALAMQGFIATTKGPNTHTSVEVAEAAVKYAGALLRELERTVGDT